MSGQAAKTKQKPQPLTAPACPSWVWAGCLAAKGHPVGADPFNQWIGELEGAMSTAIPEPIENHIKKVRPTLDIVAEVILK